MKSIIARYFILIFILHNSLFAQEKTFNISGFVTDALSGESLVGANLLLYKDTLDLNSSPYTGTAANKFGYYVIPSLQKGNYYLITRHVGYKTNISEIVVVCSRVIWIH